MFTKALALEFSEHGILANTVSPGLIYSNETAEWFTSEESKRIIKESIPINRAGQPEEIAKVVSFLCSDDASYINGTTIYVDGGCLLTNTMT